MGKLLQKTMSLLRIEIGDLSTAIAFVLLGIGVSAYISWSNDVALNTDVTIVGVCLALFFMVFGMGYREVFYSAEELAKFLRLSPRPFPTKRELASIGMIVLAVFALIAFFWTRAFFIVVCIGGGLSGLALAVVGNFLLVRRLWRSRTARRGH